MVDRKIGHDASMLLEPDIVPNASASEDD